MFILTSLQAYTVQNGSYAYVAQQMSALAPDLEIGARMPHKYHPHIPSNSCLGGHLLCQMPSCLHKKIFFFDAFHSLLVELIAIQVHDWQRNEYHCKT
jgi:hypothetical protein